jgi:hypothetical protein
MLVHSLTRRQNSEQALKTEAAGSCECQARAYWTADRTLSQSRTVQFEFHDICQCVYGETERLQREKEEAVQDLNTLQPDEGKLLASGFGCFIWNSRYCPLFGR